MHNIKRILKISTIRSKFLLPTLILFAVVIAGIICYLYISQKNLLIQEINNSAINVGEFHAQHFKNHMTPALNSLQMLQNHIKDAADLMDRKQAEHYLRSTLNSQESFTGLWIC